VSTEYQRSRRGAPTSAFGARTAQSRQPRISICRRRAMSVREDRKRDQTQAREVQTPRGGRGEILVPTATTPLLDLKPDRTLFTPIAPAQAGDLEAGDPSGLCNGGVSASDNRCCRPAGSIATRIGPRLPPTPPTKLIGAFAAFWRSQGGAGHWEGYLQPSLPAGVPSLHVTLIAEQIRRTGHFPRVQIVRATGRWTLLAGAAARNASLTGHAPR
jgi:hypothetical protein